MPAKKRAPSPRAASATRRGCSSARSSARAAAPSPASPMGGWRCAAPVHPPCVPIAARRPPLTSADHACSAQVRRSEHGHGLGLFAGVDFKKGALVRRRLPLPPHAPTEASRAASFSNRAQRREPSSGLVGAGSAELAAAHARGALTLAAGRLRRRAGDRGRVQRQQQPLVAMADTAKGLCIDAAPVCARAARAAGRRVRAQAGAEHLRSCGLAAAATTPRLPPRMPSSTAAPRTARCAPTAPGEHDFLPRCPCCSPSGALRAATRSRGRTRWRSGESWEAGAW